MQNTPKALRLQIGIFGKRNVGKSSLLNAITRQAVSIVSDTPGTTTDPVEKPMEMLPLGPVLFIDTAGIDDSGALGAMRVEKTRKIFERADLAILVAEASGWNDFEETLLKEFTDRKIPSVVVFNKSDISVPSGDLSGRLSKLGIISVQTVAKDGGGITELRQAMIKTIPEESLAPRTIIGDLIPPGELAMLVVPIDLEAPKGRLILPQVQTIRDVLDNDSYCMVVKERELKAALERLKSPPSIVVTDSQAFLKVSGDVPDNIRLTSFSILFARLKGELSVFVKGALAIDGLKAGDKVLIAEACAHHPIGDDIGRVKIPRWLTQYCGGKLEITHVQGADFPEDISPYKLIIHCGGCTFNRRQMLSRILKCSEAGIPLTNYGIAIAFSLGIMERALSPFPLELEIYNEAKKL